MLTYTLMIRKTKLKTYEDINIIYSDKLLTKYQFNGSFSHDDLRQEKEIKLTDEEKKLYTDSGMEWFPTLTGFMISSGYFFDDEQQRRYVISERGNLAKELGGHEKFKEHRKSEIDLLKHQRWINWGLIITTSLAIIFPFGMEILKRYEIWPFKSQDPPVFQIQNHVDIHLDSIYLKSFIDSKFKNNDSLLRRRP
jgi:hypothetical protein